MSASGYAVYEGMNVWKRVQLELKILIEFCQWIGSRSPSVISGRPSGI